MKRYNPREIEPKWQNVWAETGIYKTDMSRTADKFYIIPMLPYPSGDLHVGHWYNFAPTDTVARWRRMMGQNVLQTIGFDAFGLPAENAAIKRDIQPAKWTRGNIADMTKQIGQIGASYDWDHSLITCDPEYYRWNQWLFLKLYEKGLAYRKKALVNWCPKDQTVLANEQVVGENNVCERCGTPVVQKELEQWFYKITDYADRLLDDLGNVDWPQKVKVMQENWIGRSRGALINFKIDGVDKELKVFTTRPDTIYGATYMVIAPEHHLVKALTTDEQKANVEQYVAEAARKTELERKEGEKHKSGVFSGSYALNPATKEKIPIWIADYVLMGYGTGAIMAVPAHDERDWQFAQKFKLPIKEVVAHYYVYDDKYAPREGYETLVRPVVDAIIKNTSDEYFLIVEDDNCHFVGGGIETGESDEEALKREVAEESGYVDIESFRPVTSTRSSHGFRVPKNKNQRGIGKFYEVVLKSDKKIKSEIDEGLHKGIWLPKDKVEAAITWQAHLLAWRQYQSGQTVYSGEGILINSDKYNDMDSAEARDKIVADLEKQGVAKEQTNYRLRDWLISRQRYWGTPIPIVYCDKCGMLPVPEDQLPVVLPEDVEFQLTGQSPLIHRPDFVDTKCPNCNGPAKRETDTMDTFMDSSWYFLRYIDNKNDKALFDAELVNKWAPVDHYIGGIEHAILHLLYARFMVKFLRDYHGLGFEEPFKKLTNQGIILGPDGQKMSKSRGNVVAPDEQVASYGADSLRLYLMFMGPYDQGGPYSLGGIAGTRRFLDRFWTLTQEFLEAPEKPVAELDALTLQAEMHRTVKKVTKDIESLSFNTAIAAMMSFVNELYKFKAEHNMAQNPPWRTALETLTQLLAPFAPHIAEEIWKELGHDESVHATNWPAWDEELVAEDLITIAVQVNGKVRAEIVVDKSASKEEIIKLAKEDKKVTSFLDGKKIKKEIYVPGRLVSLVI